MSLKSVLITLFTASAVVVGAGAAGAAFLGESGPERAKVVKVVDGDTLDVAYGGETHRIRLLNIDAPETKDPNKLVECVGPEAHNYLAETLKPGEFVRLEFDVELYDKWGRELAGVFEDDVLINAEIARHGFGVPVIFEPNRKFYPPVLEAYEEAKANGVGIFDPAQLCTLPSQVEDYEQQVSVFLAASIEDADEAEKQSAALVARGVALVGLIDALTPDSLESAGLTAGELDGYRARIAASQGNAQKAAEEVRAEADRKVAAEKAAKKKAEEAAKKKAEEKARKEAEAKKAAEEKARQEAEEKAERERQAEADRRAEEERRAEQERQAQPAPIQPLMPQPAPQPAPPPAPAPPSNVWYKNCDAARAAGAAPVRFGDPGYGRHLDRDGDGVGCE